MRTTRASIRSIVAAGATFALTLLIVGGQPTSSAADDPGQAVFLAQKCNMCHAVPAVGIEAKVQSAAMKGPDIAGVTRDADTLKKFLRKQEKIDGKDHKKEFKGTDEELDVIVTWVLAQK